MHGWSGGESAKRRKADQERSVRRRGRWADVEDEDTMVVVADDEMAEEQRETFEENARARTDSIARIESWIEDVEPV